MSGSLALELYPNTPLERELRGQRLFFVVSRALLIENP